jgi:hypothetical protein
VRARALTLRAVALLAAGSAAVHQLRYAVGYGHNAAGALAAQGHAYLTALLPFFAALVVVVIAAMLRAPLTPAHGRRPSLRSAWVAAFVTLVAVFFAQELLEGIFSTGHPHGLAGVFGADGWVAVLLAAPIALLIAVALRGNGALDPGLRLRFGLIVPRAAQAPARAPELFVTRITGVLGARGPPLSSAC